MEVDDYLSFIGEVDADGAPLHIPGSSNNQDFDTKQFQIPYKKSQNYKLNKKMLLQMSASEGSSKCKLCGKTLSSTGALLNHIRSIHEGIKHQCEVCNKTFSTAQNLRNHFHVVHEGIKNYSCQLCGKSFST